jgi:SAM-dependent methyltransferase
MENPHPSNPSNPGLDDFWEHRWQNNLTGWDLGAVSPPLAAYIDQWTNRDAAVLIPGCGNAYEAEYLLDKGFTNITVIDIAPSAVVLLRERLDTGHAGWHDRLTILCGDFFEHRGAYDLILEQTFFCALDPSMRGAYARHMQSLLKPGGKLAGVMFDRDF